MDFTVDLLLVVCGHAILKKQHKYINVYKQEEIKINFEFICIAFDDSKQLSTDCLSDAK